MKKLWIVVIILILIIIPLSWYLLSPLLRVVEVNEPSPVVQRSMEEEMERVKGEVVEEDEEMPTGEVMLVQGAFVEQAHEVAGKALLFEVDGEKVLRFENFETINGPDLRIYLSADLTNDDFVEVGKIKATKGNVNYELPAGVDTEKYNNVLVWCKPFGVLFSSATLT